MMGQGRFQGYEDGTWNTLVHFLDEEGHGYSHFGSQILGEQGLERSMVWTLDKLRIIETVVPLLRRMVSNERQREI